MINRGHLFRTAAIALWLGATGLEAQVIRLPAVMPPSEGHPERVVSYPDSGVELPQPLTDFSRRRLDFSYAPLEFSPPPADAGSLVYPHQVPTDPRQPQLELAPLPNPDRPPDARPGMFQKIILTSAWLDSGGSRGLGITEVDLRCVLALPIPSRDSPLIITPGFGAYFLQWPDSPDLPPQLYDVYTQFRWFHRINRRLMIDLAVAPGVFSDFEQDTDEAFRIPGHGAAIWTLGPTAKLVGGVGYFDRLDVKALPIGGIIWTPHQDVKFELLFPKPKIAHRIYWHGASTDEVQDWVYVAGEFGGGTWAIRRASGANDRLNYRDFRVLLGIERKAIGKLDYRFEVGYVFGRELEYASPTPDVEPSDTVMFRGGLTY